MTEMLPLLTPSYNRPNAPLVSLAKQCLRDEYPWWVFVRRSQARDYREFVPRDHLVTMPDSEVHNLGETRNWMLMWATREGYDQVFDWDDDVFRFGRKLPDGARHLSRSWRSNNTGEAWFEGPGFWQEASRVAREVFELYPGTVVGNIQNQRWAKTWFLKVLGGQTPRRTKILNVERLVENNLFCPPEFRQHGEDIGNAAMYLQYGWETFTLGGLLYDFVPETDVHLPSTLRSRDEAKNKRIHAAEFKALQQYEIRDYLRVNKAYPDGTYMYGDVDWVKYRKVTGNIGYSYEYSNIMDRVPLKDIPFTISK